jgi:hypothetical protein
MQQALDYAETLKIPFVFSSNGDGFVFHDRTGASTPRESNLGLDAFPSPADLWARFRCWKGLDGASEEIVLQDYHDDGSGKEPLLSGQRGQRGDRGHRQGSSRTGGGGMNKTGKDAPEVIEFMTLFSRLKLYSDDAPEGLADQAASDSSVRDLCTQLSLSAHFLKMNERRARVLFAAPVDPAFLAAWRDYEDRYEAIVSGIWLSDILPELASAEPSRVPRADLQWDNADDEA